jgi:hypothetical protein
MSVTYILKCTECGGIFDSLQKEPAYQLCNECLDEWKQRLMNRSFSDEVQDYYVKHKPEVLGGAINKRDYMMSRLKTMDNNITFSYVAILQILKVYGQHHKVDLPTLVSMLADQHLRWKSVAIALSNIELATEVTVSRVLYEAEFGADNYKMTKEGREYVDELKALCCYAEGPKDDDEEKEEDERFAQIG